MAVCGDLGTFKTTFLMWWSLHDAELGREVYSTIPLTGYAKQTYPEIASRYHLITSIHEFFLQRLKQAKGKPFEQWNDLLILDEAYILLPSRGSSAPANTMLAAIVELSRKLGLQLVYAAPLLSQVELRLRHLSELYIITEKRINRSGEAYAILHPFGADAVTTEIKAQRARILSHEECLKVWPCFGSTVIAPIESDTLIHQLEAYLGLGEDEAEPESIVAVRKFMAAHPNIPFDVVSLSNNPEFADIQIADIRNALRYLAEIRVLQIVEAGRGHTRQTFVFPQTKEARILA